MTKFGASLCAISTVASLIFGSAKVLSEGLPEDVQFKTATKLVNAGDVRGGCAILQKLVQKYPKAVVFKTALANCYIGLDDLPHALEQANQALLLDPREKEALYVRGNILLVQRKWSESLKSFQTLLALEPDDARALVGRASVYIFLKKFAAAKKDIAHVMAKDPGNHSAHMSLVCYYNEQGKTQDCIEACSAALKYMPNDAALYVARSQGYTAEHLYDKALADQRRALELHPRNLAEVHAIMGGTCIYAGRFKEGLIYLNKALALEPNKPNALNLAAVSYFQVGDIDNAIIFGEKTLKVVPTDVMALSTLGQCYLRKGRLPEAIKSFTKAIKQLPRADFYLGRAEAEQRLGNFAAALQDCNTSIEKDKKPPRVFVIRGESELSLSDAGKARADFEHALALSPDNFEAKRMLAQCLKAARSNPEYNLMTSESERNPAALDDDVKLHPHDAAALVRRGNYLLKSLESERAIADYTAAIKLSPNMANAYVHRGIAYRALRHFDKALADYAQALQIDPKNAQALLESARLNRVIKKTDASLKNYDRLQALGSCDLVYLERGDLLLSLKRWQPALKDADKAIACHAGREEYKLRADALMASGQYREAIASYSDAIRLGNPEAPLLRGRALAYEKVGEKELAAADQKLVHKLEAEVYETAPFSKNAAEQPSR